MATAQNTIVHNSFGQSLFNFSSKHNKSQLQYGAIYVGGNKDKYQDFFLEFGYNQTRYAKGGHDAGYLRLSKMLTVEKSMTNMSDVRIKTGFAIENFLTIGLYLMLPTNLKNVGLDFCPEIGFRYYNFLLSYNYQINILQNQNLTNLFNLHHNFGLKYTMPIHNKNKN